MVDDVVLAKVATIQRCLARIEEVTRHDPERLRDQNVEDIFVLNLQRAVQAAIDIGSHVLASAGLEMPTKLRDIFVVLEERGWISAPVSRQMQKVCGFRNIAVHDYQAISKAVLQGILVHNLQDLEQFYVEILAHQSPRQ